MVDLEVGARVVPVPVATLERRLVTVQLAVVDDVVGTELEQPGLPLPSPDPIRSILVRRVPKLANFHPERPATAPAIAADRRFRTAPELALDAVVGVERDRPRGPLAERRR